MRKLEAVLQCLVGSFWGVVLRCCRVRLPTRVPKKVTIRFHQGLRVLSGIALKVRGFKLVQL